MLEWLRELDSFHRIGSAVVAILPILAAACLGAFLATWLQEWLRVRREHLAAIKAEVFRPLRRELQEFYLPLLSGKIGPVTIAQVAAPVPEAGDHPLTVSANAWQLQLCRTRPPEAGQMDLLLYADAKFRHYRRIFRRWELFKSEVDAYTRRWVSYAEQLSRTVREQSGLPLITEADPLSNTEWIDPDGLAVFVVNCQLAIGQRPLCLGPDGRSLEIGGTTMAHAAAEDPIQRSLKLLRVLCDKRETLDSLHPQAEALRHLAKYLLRELDRLRRSSKLPGGCRLARL
ncbi:MAG: hypothetical protein DME09_02285 [Candidatus Rokuibacteriota bacterium]|nr:MAG: hypothetical protein DME09_02285 [Candidatus Rokubacteria bacterium]